MTRIAPKDLSAKKPELKQFYSLVVGTVMFYVKSAPVGADGNPDVASMPLNAILKSTHGQFPASALADAQIALTQALINKIGESEPVEIVDVQLANIVKLGHMFPHEFHDLQVQVEPTAEEVAPAKVE